MPFDIFVNPTLSFILRRALYKSEVLLGEKLYIYIHGIFLFSPTKNARKSVPCMVFIHIYILASHNVCDSGVG